MRVPSADVRRRSLGLRGWLIGAAIVLLILLLSIRGFAQFYTDYLWFKDVGFSKTWRGLISAKAVPALIFSATFFVLMLVNLIVADRIAPKFHGGGQEDEIIERYRGYIAPYAGRIRVGVSLFFALVMGSGVASEWRNWILFSHATSFGIKDPQFHKDVGFYVFRLPFLQFAAGWVFAALLVVLIVTAVFHYLNGGIRIQSPFQRVTPQVKVHLSVILALMALTKTVQYYLSRFSLTLSHRGFVDGATYTDVKAQLPAFNLLMLISVAAAVLFILNIWRRGWVFPIIAVGLWAFISIVVGTIYPAVIQRFIVQPNELTREEPYIKRNIEATRAAFNLDNIAQRTFDYTNRLNPADVTSSQDTLSNVRLWDPDPIKSAFQITQEIQTFYAFRDVDVDRYRVGDEAHKPALSSVRELDPTNLPDKSWTNQHLVYTHGEGVVAAAGDAVNQDSPSYLLQGIPPSGDPDLKLTKAGVYFGENLSGYSVVDTKVVEQEAASRQTTRGTKYTGNAGVPVSNVFRRAALALRFGDWNLFVSGQLTSKSRVIYIRNPLERVKTAAPFLRFDNDPYPVVLNGRILWVIDAYTTTNRYPYSQSLHPSNLPSGSGLDMDLNYVRNSVKATVDAYDGTIHFYVVDKHDPIIRAYRKAFPELFEDVSKMPRGLQAHWRYPEDIFDTQTEQYTLYHMTDPTEFFRKQDLWDIAPAPDISNTGVVTNTSAVAGNNGGRNTTLAASGTPINSLYLTMQLPGRDGKDGQEFLLTRSFTPRRKANLASFMMARNDPAHYGQIVLYSTENSAALSPAQAASSIESDPTISQEFTLLNQQQSKVIRGDVQLIPIGSTIMYVRPIWVEGESSQTYPRYRFVAGVVGDRAVLGFDVQDAATALANGTRTRAQALQFGNTGGVGNVSGPGTTTPTTTPGGSTTTTTPTGTNATVQQLLAQATDELAAADAALKSGNLAQYQAHVNRARTLVGQAEAKATGGNSPTTQPGPTTSTTGPAHA
jgi:uncharacterized membrane protein (UPF0182 family)